MSSVTLLRRTNVANGTFTPVRAFKSYHAAIIHAQEFLPRRSWMIDTGTRVPSRKEQLLFDETEPQPQRKKASRRLQQLLSDL